MKIIFSPKKFRLIYSSLAIMFAVVVLSISLISASQAVSYEGLLATQKKLYFNEALLPDHILYPFVAAADQLLLIPTSGKKKIELQLAYGGIRLDYAWGLLEKGEKELALVALTKSQKYMHLAGEQMVDANKEDELFYSVLVALEENVKQSEKIIKLADVRGKDLAIDLNNQNQLLLNKLRSKND
ncbi:MAG: hypothetical protein XD95_0612 [Microgenomates bacterium 39_7]|nr:MAG: hypothetical protein XD95_0612 [Microgenomates bacterium 39_7]